MNGDVHVHLDLVQPEEQRIRVTMRWTGSTSRQILQFPLWTPGSYTIRDPVQHLHSLQLTAATGFVPLRRLAPHQWLVDDLDPGPLCLTYVVEARDLTVRTAFVDPEFASFSLAAVVMELDGCRWTPHRLSVNCADDWQVHCPLLRHRDGWRAADFDDLLDSPVQAGPFGSHPFRVQELHHELLLMGDPPGGWPTTLKADVERVCEATCRLMGTPPPAGDRYQLVIQMLDSGYGGLEHDHSAVLQFNWSALTKPDGYRQLLQLVGHEYLHQWNVRRLRPREFRPYDYGHPVVSEGLWFAEGITSYFDLVLPLLAGCSDRSTLLKDLSDELSRVLMAPGRRVQSLAASAQEAWVKLYKATAVSADSQISYYRLGAATAFCLDVRLRQRHSSLAEQLRALWMTHGTVGRGFVREDLTVLLKAIDPGLAEDLDRWLDSPDALPLQDTAALIGARFDPIPLAGPDHGLTLADVNGRVVVRRVALDSPGRAAALVPGDELIAIDGRRGERLSRSSLAAEGGSTGTGHLWPSQLPRHNSTLCGSWSGTVVPQLGTCGILGTAVSERSMVPVSLIQKLERVADLIRLHPRAAVAVAATGSLAVLLGSWVSLDRSKPSHAGTRPSLMDLLEQVESGKDTKSPPAVEPQRAPRSRSWTSPLAKQCTGIDSALRSRLEAVQRSSDVWRTTVPIHPTNFGERFSKDAYGAPLDPSPRVVVMHETVYSLTSAINTFQTPHPLDADQASYHTLIGLDGRVVDIVDPLKRAYGAGNSAFLGEWAVTNPRLLGSLNNFALHVSLETPESGANDASQHTGYTSRQYDALAVVLSDWINRFKLPPAAITTHRHVDLGEERGDPRSFNWASLQYRLAALGDLCVS